MVALAPLAGLNAPLDADTFLRMADEGAFGHARVELIEGEVIFKVAQNRLHIAALRLVERALQRLEAEGRTVFPAPTIRLGTSAPDPDLAVLAYDPTRDTHPITGADALLVVEISVSSLKGDREAKTRLYAEAGIPEYWIVNPVARQVEIRRDPIEREYRTLEVYGEDESAAPLFAPDQPVGFAAFWPAPEPQT